ncbi:hypothetical protein Tco_0314008 [Tanacetum coccineum]
MENLYLKHGLVSRTYSNSSWHRPLAPKDLALYDNESWNDLRDFAKPVKAIALPQDVPINKITTQHEICSGPQDTQYYMEDPEQALVEYTSSRTDEAGEGFDDYLKAYKFGAEAVVEGKELFLGEDATRAIPNMGFNLVDVEGVWFGFFLQMGFILILATLDGLDVGLLGDVIGGDDCDDDE